MKNYRIEDFPEFTPYMMLNYKPHQKMLFVFPPEYAGAESYLKFLVTYFNHDYTLVLFNNLYLHIQKIWPIHKYYRLEQSYFANHYADIMEYLNTENEPYNLFGTSYGGSLSVTIMDILLERRNKVNNLFVVDGIIEPNKNYARNNLNSSDTRLVLFKAGLPSTSLVDKLHLYLSEGAKFELVHMDYVMVNLCLKNPKLIDYYNILTSIKEQSYLTIDNHQLEKLLTFRIFNKMFAVYDRVNNAYYNYKYNGFDRYFQPGKLILNKMNISHMDILENPNVMNQITKCTENYLFKIN